MPRYVGWIGLTLLVIVLDQATAFAITHAMSFGDSIAITPFFDLVLVYTNGAFQNLVYAKYLLYEPNRNLAIERYRKAKKIDKNVFDQELERWMKILDNNEKIGLKSGN